MGFLFICRWSDEFIYDFWSRMPRMWWYTDSQLHGSMWLHGTNKQDLHWLRYDKLKWVVGWVPPWFF